MTEAEFVAGWLERSGITAEQLRQMGMYPEPCSCDYEGCEGWGMVRAHEAAIVEDMLRSRV